MLERKTNRDNIHSFLICSGYNKIKIVNSKLCAYIKKNQTGRQRMPEP